jgi:hypothetical protein
MIAGGNNLATLKVIANILYSYFLSLILGYKVKGLSSKTKASHSDAKARTIKVFPEPWGPKKRK